MKCGEESVSLSVGMSEGLGIWREDLPKKQMNATIPIEYATRLPLLPVGFLKLSMPIRQTPVLVMTPSVGLKSHEKRSPSPSNIIDY
jgi:hypothetical protein